MPVSAGIYNALNQPVRSVADYAADYDQADIRKQGMQRNALMMQEAQAAMADRERLRKQTELKQNALLAITQSGAAPENVEAGMLAHPMLYDEGNKRREDRLKAGELQGKNLKAEQDAREAKLKADQMARFQTVQQIASLPTPDAAIAQMNAAMGRGELPMQTAVAFERMIRSDPNWQLKLALGALEPEKMAELLKPHLQTIDAGGFKVAQAVNKITGVPTETGRTEVTLDANSRAQIAATMRGQDLTAATTRRGQDLTDQRTRESNDATLSKPFEVTGPEGTPILVQQDKTGKIVPVQGFAPKGGNPSKVADAKEAIALLDQGETLIKGATGSTIGAGIDAVAQAFGVATPGSIKAQQLKALEGALIAKMPKMSGPQSDKDVLLYRQMAGLIGDDTVPYQRKAAAMGTVREIQERYAGMAPGASRPNPAAPSGGPAVGSVVDGYRFKGGNPADKANWEKQ